MAVGGWFVVVIEAMIAAPLWAVMHASPEGHEWSGKGAQGYQLVLGVILRPSLMLFGLIGAMLLFRVMCVLALMMMGLSASNLGDALSDNYAGAGVSGNGLVGVIVITFINIWLLQKIFARLLEMIGSVTSSIMRWIGGGIDPFQDNTAEAGKGFAQQIMGRGESAAQAGMGAAKNKRDIAKGDTQHKASIDAQDRQTAAIEKQTATFDKMTGNLMGGSANGGKGGSTGGSDKQDNPTTL